MKKSAAPALILIFLILAVGIFVVFRRLFSRWQVHALGRD